MIEQWRGYTIERNIHGMYVATGVMGRVLADDLDVLKELLMSQEDEVITALETPEIRVRNGAILLDEKRPGWADQIDLDKLDMEDGCEGVLVQLGQLFGFFEDSLDELEICNDGIEDNELKEAWIQEVKARRSQ